MNRQIENFCNLISTFDLTTEENINLLINQLYEQIRIEIDNLQENIVILRQMNFHDIIPNERQQTSFKIRLMNNLLNFLYVILDEIRNNE